MFSHKQTAFCSIIWPRIIKLRWIDLNEMKIPFDYPPYDPKGVGASENPKTKNKQNGVHSKASVHLT